MIDCQIVCHHIPAGPPYYANGAMTTACQCTTHQFTVTGPVSVGDRCAIGRIEKTIEDGIARIEAALTHA